MFEQHHLATIKGQRKEVTTCPARLVQQHLLMSWTQLMKHVYHLKSSGCFSVSFDMLQQQGFMKEGAAEWCTPAC
jgi:hypothetical protein